MKNDWFSTSTPERGGTKKHTHSKHKVSGSTRRASQAIWRVTKLSIARVVVVRCKEAFCPHLGQITVQVYVEVLVLFCVYKLLVTNIREVHRVEELVISVVLTVRQDVQHQ